MPETISLPKEYFDQQIIVTIEPLLNKIKLLEENINELKTGRELLMTNEEALSFVKRELLKSKAKGIKEIDVIDINKKTHLPLAQISALMNILEKDGVIKAV